jgi:hypothetical protein
MSSIHTLVSGNHKVVHKMSFDGASVDIQMSLDKNTGVLTKIICTEKMEDLTGIRNLYWEMLQCMLPHGVLPDAPPAENEQALLKFCRERYALHNAAFFGVCA